jgi:two-component system LytT family response regulator
MTATDLRVLVVEDEAPARRTMRDLLATIDGVACVGEAWGSGALDEVRELCPDIVLLDVRMPGMSGFEILRKLGAELGDDMPVVVVVTAHEEHAVEAFEVRAIDYLLKPFTDARFREAVDRAVERTRTRFADLGAAVHTPFRAGQPDRLVLEDAGTTLVFPTREVRWIEASGPYVVIHTDREHLVRRSLTSLEDELAARGFVRVHRSALLNLEAVRAVRPLSHGDAVAVLDDGTQVRVSRSRREAFLAILQRDSQKGG